MKKAFFMSFGIAVSRENECTGISRVIMQVGRTVFTLPINLRYCHPLPQSALSDVERGISALKLMPVFKLHEHAQKIDYSSSVLLPIPGEKRR